MPTFDRYVAVDWSASASPTTGPDSIWVADQVRGRPVDLANHATRAVAERWLHELIDGLGGRRVLIGVDASLGYPRGSAERFGLDGTAWRAMWSEIDASSTDDERNRNNRFDVAADFNRRAGAASGPFWGCPSDRWVPTLLRTKPAGFEVPEFRLVEESLRRRGRSPKSCWQLLGAGSVGSQTLTLLPILHRLLDRVAIWPLTTGLRTPPADAEVVVAEIWPSWFAPELPPGMVKDAAQVAGSVEAIARADADGTLDRWWSPQVCDEAAVVDEEGWILGVDDLAVV